MVYLELKGVHSLGKVYHNRIPNCKLPNIDKLKNKARGYSEESVACIDGCEISSLVWKDKKVVTMLSSLAGTHPVSEVSRYNRKQRNMKKFPVRML